MRKLLIVVTAMLAALTNSHAAIAADTVFVMRHLEKGEGADPALSNNGTANAQALVPLLAGQGIKAIFATPTRRALETAQPLAVKLGIPVTPYDPGKADLLVNAVAGIKGAVLIVGHSNTVPDIVARFGGTRKVMLSDEDYGTVFVVRHGSGEVREIKVAAQIRP